MQWTPQRRRALYKAGAVLLGTAMLCGSFFAVPYIASAIPSDLADRLTDAPRNPPLAALHTENRRPQTADPDESSAEPSETSSVSVAEPSEPDESSSAPTPSPPAGALTVLAENFCWYTDPANAALNVINRTDYAVDLADYLRRSYPVSLSDAQADEPLVLIYHTHGSESYLPAGVDYYLPEEDFRSEDASETVVAVGDVIAETLESLGIPVLHDRVMHDLPDFNNAYADSRTAARKALAAHPSIRYILDIHRDSIFTQDDRCEKTLTTVDGKQTAQLMLVVGTDQDGAVHPNWRQNLTVATHLQQLLNETYPTLARPVNLRSSAFNQALLPGALLVEVGSCGNTVEEAKEAGRLFAETFASLLRRKHALPSRTS